MRNSIFKNFCVGENSACGTLAGIFFVLLGVFCMSYPILASISVDIVIGASLFIGGVLACLRTPVRFGRWNKFFYTTLAALYALLGAALIWNPFEGTQALMILFGTAFLVEGVVALVYWNKLRESAAGVPVLMKALVSILLSVLVLFNIEMGIWFIGVLVGVNFVFVGFEVLFFPVKRP